MAKFSALLNDLHRSLDLKFKESKSKEQARQLEEFFNYIVYNSHPSDLNGVLTTELAEAVKQNNPEIAEQFKQIGTTSSETGQLGEKAFANCDSRLLVNYFGGKSSWKRVAKGKKAFPFFAKIKVY